MRRAAPIFIGRATSPYTLVAAVVLVHTGCCGTAAHCCATVRPTGGPLGARSGLPPTATTDRRDDTQARPCDNRAIAVLPLLPETPSTRPNSSKLTRGLTCNRQAASRIELVHIVAHATNVITSPRRTGVA